MPGLLGVVEPVFRLLAKRARRKGIDRELEAKYMEVLPPDQIKRGAKS
jgi:hypothetical protein